VPASGARIDTPVFADEYDCMRQRRWSSMNTIACNNGERVAKKRPKKFT
jgi:hypothetical protein